MWIQLKQSRFHCCKLYMRETEKIELQISRPTFRYRIESKLEAVFFMWRNEIVMVFKRSFQDSWMMEIYSRIGKWFIYSNRNFFFSLFFRSKEKLDRRKLLSIAVGRGEMMKNVLIRSFASDRWFSGAWGEFIVTCEDFNTLPGFPFDCFHKQPATLKSLWYCDRVSLWHSMWVLARVLVLVRNGDCAIKPRTTITNSSFDLSTNIFILNENFMLSLKSSSKEESEKKKIKEETSLSSFVLSFGFLLD